MMTREINFDGLIGPSHNYAGLSVGNVASFSNKGGVAKPKMAALQGLAKMRTVMALGLVQGVLPPHPRPAYAALQSLGFSGNDAEMAAQCWREDPVLFANVFSASAMWTANAGTISPSADTRDGKLHVSPANLVSNLHRAQEPPFTHKLLSTLFANDRFFVVHPPLPMKAHFGDEGAANHGRLCLSHGHQGVEIFVFAEKQDGKFPARQTLRASQAIARRHQLPADRTLFLQQSNRAIECGAFHNDVVSVANGRVLFTHEAAFEHRDAAYASIRAAMPEAVVVEVAEADVPLKDAIKSYLFNSQLLTLPDDSMALVLPSEVQETASTRAYLEKLLKLDTPIQAAQIIDVRESMRNGGGPACLRLRVSANDDEFAALDQRFLLTEQKISALESIVQQTYPEEIESTGLGDPVLHRQVMAATQAVYACLGLSALLHD
jgi:succinylarginine dihydrolase